MLFPFGWLVHACDSGMSDNKFWGPIGETIGALTNLEYMDVGWNPRFDADTAISGSIPASIGNLLNLRYLKLAGNKINGGIPKTITKLKKLEFLSVAFNSMNADLPDFLSELTALRQIDLSSCQFSGSLPSTIGRLTNLTQMWLADNHFNGSVPDSWSSLTQLQALEGATMTCECCSQAPPTPHSGIAGNALSGTVPAAFFNLKSLTQLNFGNTSLSGPIPSEISSLVQLKWTDGKKANFSGPLPTTITRMTTLERFILNNNSLSGELPAELGQNPALKDLGLGSNYLEGSVPESFSGLTNLTKLVLSNNSLSGSLPTIISTLTSLSILNLHNNNFEGSLPNLPYNLTTVDLSGNNFTGAFPENIAQLDSLASLNVSSNRLSGSLPSELSSLVALTSLNTSRNQFSGAIPTALQNLKLLNSLDLSGNSLSGSIPDFLSVLTSLQSLNLSSNSLSDTLSASLGALDQITCLNLSRSSLTGPIPDSFTSLSDLVFLDLSYTGVAGSVPWGINSLGQLQALYGTLSIFCNDNATCPAAPPPPASPLPPPAPPANPTSPAVTNSTSPGSDNSSTPNTTCHVCQSYCLGCSPSAPSSPPASSSSLSPRAIAGIVAALIALLALIALVILLWFCFRQTKPACKQYSLADIHQATNFFSEVNLIGSGGFSDVYKGVDPSDPEVLWAVKRATVLSNDFMNEVAAMARLKHPSLVPLLGYCIDYNEQALQMEQIIVTQFMPNGDLAHWTEPGAKPMTLRQRLAVLVDVADGLSFLHSRRIVHRDVKPANVLLDAHMRAKVADFGFMRKMEASQVQTTRVMGTPGYEDPEYLQTRLATTATDVYSFGVLLLEILTGKEPILSVDCSQSHIREWVAAELSSGDVSSIIDPRMVSPAASGASMVHADVMKSLASLAMECSAMPAASRPSMAKVLSQLKQLHEEVVRREGESGLQQGSGLGGLGTGGASWLVRENRVSPAPESAVRSVSAVRGTTDDEGSPEEDESLTVGEVTSGEASRSMGDDHN
ncbi:unnamed protein product [Closterium sp. Yama58-4]|nr:unnamed protein product [Closterium sp. Yama58-4]